jgi:hypothetical protein
MSGSKIFAMLLIFLLISFWVLVILKTNSYFSGYLDFLDLHNSFKMNRQSLIPESEWKQIGYCDLDCIADKCGENTPICYQTRTCIPQLVKCVNDNYEKCNCKEH